MGGGNLADPVPRRDRSAPRAGLPPRRTSPVSVPIGLRGAKTSTKGGVNRSLKEGESSEGRFTAEPPNQARRPLRGLRANCGGWDGDGSSRAPGGTRGISARGRGQGPPPAPLPRSRVQGDAHRGG